MESGNNRGSGFGPAVRMTFLVAASRGWNVHVDKVLDGKTIRALAGPYNDMDEATKRDHYVQIW